MDIEQERRLAAERDSRTSIIRRLEKEVGQSHALLGECFAEMEKMVGRRNAFAALKARFEELKR